MGIHLALVVAVPLEGEEVYAGRRVDDLHGSVGVGDAVHPHVLELHAGGQVGHRPTEGAQLLGLGLVGVRLVARAHHHVGHHVPPTDALDQIPEREDADGDLEAIACAGCSGGRRGAGNRNECYQR